MFLYNSLQNKHENHKQVSWLLKQDASLRNRDKEGQQSRYTCIVCSLPWSCLMFVTIDLWKWVKMFLYPLLTGESPHILLLLHSKGLLLYFLFNLWTKSSGSKCYQKPRIKKCFLIFYFVKAPWINCSVDGKSGILPLLGTVLHIWMKKGMRAAKMASVRAGIALLLLKDGSCCVRAE